MANSLVDQLLKITAPLSGTASPSALALLGPANEALRGLTTQLDGLRGLYQAQTSQAADHTAALTQNTRSRASNDDSSLLGVAKTAASSLSSSFTVLPLISGIAKLLGLGSRPNESPVLQSFNLPSAVDLEGGINQGGRSAVTGVSYDQNGLPRGASSTSSSATQINVNVQTLDSRSFLDHSEDIARAVREAMLSSHPINDVISEV